MNITVGLLCNCRDARLKCVAYVYRRLAENCCLLFELPFALQAYARQWLSRNLYEILICVEPQHRQQLRQDFIF